MWWPGCVLPEPDSCVYFYGAEHKKISNFSRVGDDQLGRSNARAVADLFTLRALQRNR